MRAFVTHLLACASTHGVGSVSKEHVSESSLRSGRCIKYKVRIIRVS
jgi:hypothetical protein